MSITNDKWKDQFQQLMEGYNHPTHTTEQKIFLQGDHIIRTQTPPTQNSDASKKTLKLGRNLFTSVKPQNPESLPAQKTEQKIFLQGDHIIRTQTEPPIQNPDAPRKHLKLGSKPLTSVKLKNPESTREKITTTKPAESIPSVNTKVSINQSGTGYDKPKTIALKPNTKPLSTAAQPCTQLTDAERAYVSSILKKVD